jgi:hypothetical protein
MTGTAEEAKRSATGTAYAEEVSSTATADALKVAAAATQAVEATATAKAELSRSLADLSDEFDSTSLSEAWVVYRPDPAAWDLATRPGSLHLVGQQIPDAGVRNAIGASVPDGDLAVVFRIETNASYRQYVWIAFSNGDYSGQSFLGQTGALPGQTIELGITSTGDGNAVYMWACEGESSCHTSVYGRDKPGLAKTLGHEPIVTDGSVYFKLVRGGRDYTGYYSLDGASWTFVGEVQEFSWQTPQVFLGAARDSSANDFDAYFDFAHFEVLDP